MDRIVSPALNPVRADPADLVDRDAQMAELVALLRRYLLDGNGERQRIVVTGEKGVGKTIFTRAALRALHRELGEGFLLVEVDGRGRTHRSFLDQLAQRLVESALGAPRLVPPELHPWFRELGSLLTDELRQSSTLATETTHRGATVQLKPGLLKQLETTGTLQWLETRAVAAGIQRTARVDERTLSIAIQATLRRLSERQIPTLLFFNDLDQAVNREDPEQARQTLGHLVEIENCIQVLNVRTEVLFDDIQREAMPFELDRLPSDILMQIYEKRVAREMDPTYAAALRGPRCTEIARRLAPCNGNAFAYLSWIENIFRGFDLDVFDVGSADDRAALVRRLTNFPDRALLERTAALVDKLGRVGSGWCRPAALRKNGVSKEEQTMLRRYGLLIPLDIYEPELGVRVDPRVDLLRPSVVERLG